ncbi:MAG TPA: RHS repeat-associated core domain-containing protein [Thermoanaerobaculia bacterium]|nr:RHS repeat-associated core domain-containing protein [Thermoanaerobaculia bacterium]
MQSVTRHVKVGTSWNGTSVTESSPTTIEGYDRQGRLLSVTEPSGGNGATVITSYGYDVGNRLSSVSTTSNGTTQTRTFSYDLRGFLRFENHPEKDANIFGQGHDVDYSSYDSRGHAHRSVDGGNDLSFSYDAAERPRTTYVTGGALPCTSNSPTCVKDLTYDSAGGGKLYQATRWNHILLGGAPHVSKLTHTYTYGGLDGRVSQRTLQHTFDGLTDPSKEAFVQSFTYTQLGDLDTETYPNCAAGFTSCAGSTARAVPMTYANGFLTAVVGYTSPVPNSAWGITYYPNGMTAQVGHANGVLTTYANDPNGMARPASITSALGQTTLWATGTYQYDGVGDVKQIGNGYFLYDGVSRLVSSAIVTAAVNGPVSLTQAYTFDAFGNIQTISGSSGRNTPTTSATNRLTGGTYDAAGNLTYWNGANYDYDELNQLKHYLNGAEEWLYMYDAEDERAWSFKVGAAPRFDRWTLRGLDGKVRRDYEVSGYQWNNWAAGNTWEDYIYRNGQLLAGYMSTGGRNHMDVDHLGTVRLVTNQSGLQTGYHVYYPFGEEATAFNQDSERMKFTGHERDLASLAGAGDDLDYMHARHESPVTARFLSVDTHSGNRNRPQSWNRYAYTLGNPLKLVDPDGRVAVGFTGGFGKNDVSAINTIIKAVNGAPGIGQARAFSSNAGDLALAFVLAQHKAHPFDAIVVTGHSLGANAGIEFAETLASHGLNVNLLITIDPVFGNRTVSSNVISAYNYYQTTQQDIGGHVLLPASPSVTNSWIQGVNHGDLDDAVAAAVIIQIKQAGQAALSMSQSLRGALFGPIEQLEAGFGSTTYIEGVQLPSGITR